jgi:hypothetical protein
MHPRTTRAARAIPAREGRRKRLSLDIASSSLGQRNRSARRLPTLITTTRSGLSQTRDFPTQAGGEVDLSCWSPSFAGAPHSPCRRPLEKSMKKARLSRRSCRFPNFADVNSKVGHKGIFGAWAHLVRHDDSSIAGGPVFSSKASTCLARCKTSFCLEAPLNIG